MQVKMPENKIRISAKKYTGPTSVVSIRLPNDLVLQLDAIAKETGRTRNEIVQMCLEHSVDNMEIIE